VTFASLEVPEKQQPKFSVVVPTYNRSEMLPRAIHSVLAQSVTDFELIVVDDGSSDNTESVAKSITDHRLRYVRQENRGLSAARNFGVAHAKGQWVTFLDDDDQALTNWLENFSRETTAPDAGVVCCAFIAVDEEGHPTKTVSPRQLGPAYENQVGLFLAGTFTVRRDLFDAVHGYTPGLSSTHGTELGLRLVPYCVSHGWSVRAVTEAGLRVEQRPAARRPLWAPELVYGGAKYVVERHRDRLARAPHMLANYLSIAGVSAARLGYRRDAIRFLAGAVRAEPLVPRRWGRLGLALIPPLGSLVWRRGLTASSARPAVADGPPG
jgi:glycosyltransferase involved in cell wall biosynthesis